jgi:xanthine dehydrogenase small subunit
MPEGTPSSRLTFLLNGRPIAADVPATSPPPSLLEYLRAIGATGAKEGCAEGECGACAVVAVVPHGDGSAYRAVNSCLLPLPLVAGREILTVEGLAAGDRLHPAQSAMAAAGASQCGYCTPGFVMSLFAEQYRPDRNGACDPGALAGNLCRCTGYRPIRDAALALGPAPPGDFADRLARRTPPLGAIERLGFSRPDSVDGCLSALAAHADATIVAGATDLAVEANLKGRRFPHVVSIEAVGELTTFEETPERIRIGAALTLTDLGRAWTGAPPAFAEWLALFASPLIRNRATLGGNLATASPVGDAAPLLLALDASVEIAGSARRRRVPLSEFFAGYRHAAMTRGELLTAIEIPKPLPAHLCFYKVTKRRLDDISTVAAAFALDWDAAGRVRHARFAFGGVAATPLRALEAEAAAVAAPWTEHTVAHIQAVLDGTLRPLSDLRGSAAYRLDVSKRLVEKCLVEERLEKRLERRLEKRIVEKHVREGPP